MTHSALQVGGLPMKPCTQEQTACPLIFIHLLLGPQGDGTQGLVVIGAKTTFMNYHVQQPFLS